MNKKFLLGGGVLAAIIVAVGVWFLFLKDDAPDAVTSDAANDQLDADLAAEGEAGNAEDGNAEDGNEAGGDEADSAPADEGGDAADDGAGGSDFDGTINGVWIVNDEIGEFDFETASGSFAGFRVAEELTVGEVTAVGRSGGVTGSVTITDGTLEAADVAVDMSEIISNDGRRESAIKQTVSIGEFPTADFTFSGGVDVSAVLVGGDAQTFEVAGDLTVKGTTNPVTFTIDANVREDGFGVITGSAEIVWEDFGVTPPSAPIVVSIADEGTLEFQLIVEQS